MRFPDGFLWGASMSAFQIEGATDVDGRGDSVWDMACRRPGYIAGDQHARVAADHYRRLDDDLDLIAALGLKAYRFSISWPRVVPAGVGAINPAGIGFYERLVDGLLERGVEPLPTLFHWDYPTALFQRGGWLNPESPGWFAEYAAVIVKHLGDRVTRWITINEPQCFIGFGHETGQHAPGLALPLDQVLLAAHHTLLAHGRAVEAIREHAKRDVKVGWAPVAGTCFPDTESDADINAARRATFGSSGAATELGTSRLFQTAWWCDAVHLGSYPDDLLREFGDAVPSYTTDDMRTITQPLDFFGANIYHGTRVRAGRDGAPEAVPPPPDAPTTRMGWHVTPEAMYWMARFFGERYGLPILITENGRADEDTVSADAAVHDPLRIDYLRSHLANLHRAIAEGIDVEGYCVWSLLDNFEWTHGYGPRFGIVHVDFDTQERTIKDSGHWYRALIERNALDE